MKPGVIVGIIVAVIAVAFAIYMVDFDVAGDVELPNVEVSGGEMPEVDAEVGDVDVGSKEVTVEVPTVDVTPPEERADAEVEAETETTVQN